MTTVHSHGTGVYNTAPIPCLDCVQRPAKRWSRFEFDSVGIDRHFNSKKSKSVRAQKDVILSMKLDLRYLILIFAKSLSNYSPKNIALMVAVCDC